MKSTLGAIVAWVRSWYGGARLAHAALVRLHDERERRKTAERQLVEDGSEIVDLREDVKTLQRQRDDARHESEERRRENELLKLELRNSAAVIQRNQERVNAETAELVARRQSALLRAGELDMEEAG